VSISFNCTLYVFHDDALAELVTPELSLMSSVGHLNGPWFYVVAPADVCCYLSASFVDAQSVAAEFIDALEGFIVPLFVRRTHWNAVKLHFKDNARVVQDASESLLNLPSNVFIAIFGHLVRCLLPKPNVESVRTTL